MKKIFFGLFLVAFISCGSAQQTDPQKEVCVPLTVITIAGEDVVFQHENGKLLEGKENPNAVRIPSNLILEEDRIYRIKFRYLDCDRCAKRVIRILGIAIDPIQAQKDAAEILKI